MGKTPDKVKLALSQHLSRTPFIKSTDLPYSSIIWNENLTTATLDKMDEPDCPALLIPSMQTIEAFRQHQDWFDCEEYQQQDHKKACQELKIINPKTLKIANMQYNVTLHFWQPVVIHAICEMMWNYLLKSGILADVVGLGKTWTSAVFLLSVSTLL